MAARGERADRGVGGVELPPELLLKSGRRRPIGLGGERKPLKRIERPHRGQREAVRVGDGLEALIEACGEAKPRRRVRARGDGAGGESGGH